MEINDFNATPKVQRVALDLICQILSILRELAKQIKILRAQLRTSSFIVQWNYHLIKWRASIYQHQIYKAFLNGLSTSSDTEVDFYRDYDQRSNFLLTISNFIQNHNKKLKQINLAKNSLTNFQQMVRKDEQFPSLQILDLSRNLLIQKISLELKRLKNLRRLNLSENKIKMRGKYYQCKEQRAYIGYILLHEKLVKQTLIYSQIRY